MRLPTSPEGPEIKPADPKTVSRDPSYPDRARIDSDVRAFLRPVSSPWIVFDRDSRIDDAAKSALRIGAIFRTTPMFPEPTKPEPVVSEPSTLSVASDISPEVPLPLPPRMPSSLTIPPELVRRSRAPMITAGFVSSVLALAAGVLLATPSHTRKATATAPVIVVTTARVDAPRVVETPKVEAPKAEAPVETPAAKAEAEPKTKLLGKLTIKADPKVKNVWLDGKRMLGIGSRSFLVKCGMHTVAVNDKADQKDIEIPCNGEYIPSAR